MPEALDPRSASLPPLSEEEQSVYQWQSRVSDFGDDGQRRLKGASVLISRIGGVGGAAATYLAAAGIGHLVLAHAGVIRPNDLNRQTLMTAAAIGQPRVGCARERLLQLNPRLKVDVIPANMSEQNADQLVGSVDLVIDAAPLFQERHAMNAACVRQAKPMVECAMYDMETHVTTIVPGCTPCLACLYPGVPPEWKREFPVLGSVAAMAGVLGATEAIKLIAGMGRLLTGRLLVADLRSMHFRTLNIRRDPQCAVCSGMPTK